MNQDTQESTRLERELVALGGVNESDYALQQLHYWLRNELVGGSGLFLSSFFLPYRIVFIVLVALALVFTPYMIWQLARARWYKSIWVFAALVIAPASVSFFLEGDASLARYLLLGIPLVAFYVFTLVMNLLIGSHLEDARALREVEYHRQRRLEGF